MTVDHRPRGGRRRWVAIVLTEALAPLVVSVAVMLAISLLSTPYLVSALGWWLLASLFVGVVPYTFLLIGVRRGRWTGRHVPLREQRAVPLLFAGGSVVVGLGVLVLLGAPRQLVAVVVAGLAGLTVSLLITLRWKMSIHTGVASGAATVLTVVGSALAVPAWLSVAAVAWARVDLQDHSVGQVVAGAAIAAGVFSTLR